MNAVERAQYLSEAYAIADGSTMLLPAREHVQALAELVAEQRQLSEGVYVTLSDRNRQFVYRVEDALAILERRAAR